MITNPENNVFDYITDSYGNEIQIPIVHRKSISFAELIKFPPTLAIDLMGKIVDYLF